MTISYSVSEAAQAVGLTAHTLRWYEQEGLVAPIERDTAGRRRYGIPDMEFLDLLTKLRRTGMSVKDMRRYAEMVRTGPETNAERLNLMLAHRAKVQAQIEELQRDLEIVDRKINLYRARECEL